MGSAHIDPVKERKVRGWPHDPWHRTRVRAWERHGVYLGVAWYAAMLEVPLSPAAVRRIRERSAAGDRVVLAVEGDVLAYRFPYGHRERAKRGQLNPGFLDPAATAAGLSRLAAPVRDAVAAVVLRLRKIPANEGLRWERLVELLCPWLEALPAGTVLESADPSCVVPGYLECLRRRNIGHLLRHDARVSLLESIQRPGILTAGPVVVRTGNDDDGLGPPRQGGDEEWHLGVLATVRQCVERGLPVYISVPPPDGRLLRGTTALMDADLAKLSPFRKRLAA